ncbi:TIGR03619 family F420-dependent LLM class oxidoreductase [Rhodococcus sp. CH91]|uniref:TIGR03619 family F420-dependent LLM class oxidoreductase n=1 Tax=Rhodococcus sp. CH91 TaxID=2910256 RepID=UPI001F4B7DD8|nr:TIGR03619 family F420-dependent LLM class oxidoreductase [Rhodococcus sp. CH91]
MTSGAITFGVKLPNLSPLASRDSILTTGTVAERLGFTAVWASDHVVFTPTTEHDHPDRRFPVGFDTPAVDPLVALAAVAGATERVELGTSVLVLANRNPVVVAKAWASLDLLAPGRVLAGIGTGWQENEFHALGAGDRFRRRGSATVEFIDILRTCWSDPSDGFTGEFCSFGPIHFAPRPAAGIPILLAGRSDRGLRRVASHGDGFHGTNLNPAAAGEAIARIEKYAAACGRATASRRYTTLCELDLRDRPVGPDEDHGGIHLVGTPEQVAERIRAFDAAGISHLALRVRALSGSTRKEISNRLSVRAGVEQLERFEAEVTPLIA